MSSTRSCRSRFSEDAHSKRRIAGSARTRRLTRAVASVTEHELSLRITGLRSSSTSAGWSEASCATRTIASMTRSSMSSAMAVPARVSSSIDRALADETGARRLATSPIASAWAPPRPTVTTGPRSPSATTWIRRSTPGATISWTSTWSASSPRCSRITATARRTSSARARSSATPACAERPGRRRTALTAIG